MDLEKALQFVTKYLSDYFFVFISTLRSPRAKFNPLLKESSEDKKILRLYRTDTYGAKINPKLFGFLVINIFIGYNLIRLIPSESNQIDFPSTAIVTLFFWFMYSVIIHFFFSLFGGRGSLADVLSVSLQLFGVLFVVTSFLTLIFASLILTPLINEKVITYFGLNTNIFVQSPILLHFIIELLLLFIYLPIALSYVYRIGYLRIVPASIISALLWIISSYVVFTGVGFGPMAPPPPPSPKVSLFTDPVDPSSGGSYLAIVRVLPSQPQIPVSMFIQGTDGYIIRQIGITDSLGKFTVRVPSGQVGVLDKITCKVSNDSISISVMF